VTGPNLDIQLRDLQHPEASPIPPGTTARRAMGRTIRHIASSDGSVSPIGIYDHSLEWRLAPEPYTLTVDHTFG